MDYTRFCRPFVTPLPLPLTPPRPSEMSDPRGRTGPAIVLPPLAPHEHPVQI